MQGKLLSKAPCNDDLFEGGAHKKLAGVIAEELQNDPNCTIIGIDGGWGSGKSNLVGMVENILTDETKPELLGKYHFFTYDAWGHQNDLPRRTILEELTSEITRGEDPILASQDWKERLDNLLAKKKHTSTKVVPRLNFAIIAIALMTALTPVVAAIADKITTPEGKLIFTSLVYVGFIALVVIKQICNMHKYGQSINMENFFTELFLLYKDKIKEDVKFETISEKEPSTKQFKDWMFDVNADLKKRNKILVVIIDNMDRLPKLKVQELWAALHSFFAEERYSNIRVIVPFDRAHIRNAFQSEDIQTGQEEIAVYGDDFINKTFYVVYSVPPPILTGWMHYFCDRWKDAFGEQTMVEDSVLQIYDMLTKEHSPRKIIAFINQFVTIRNLCEVAIEDKYIALFIFGRKKIMEDPLKEILNPSYLDSLDFLYREDDRMKECISSLYFQLPIQNAMDVVFTREVTLDLDEGKTDMLDRLKGTAKYWEILNHSITKVTNIENATFALNKHFGTETSDKHSQVWEALYRKSNPGSAVQDKMYHEYHNILMQNIKDKEGYYKHLVTVYHANIGDGFDLINYLDGIDGLRDSIGEMDDDYVLKQNTEIRPEQFLKLLVERESDYSKYGLNVNHAGFDDYLDGMELAEIANTSFYTHIKGKMKLPKYKEKVKQLFKDNVNNLTVETNLLKRVKEIEERPFNINNYFNDGQIYNLCNSLTEKDNLYPDVIAMLIARYEHNSNLQSYYNGHADSFSETLVKKVAGCIQYYLDYGDLLLKVSKFSYPKFVSAIAKELTMGRYGSSRMSVKEVVLNFETIRNSTGISSEDLLIKWSKWEGSFDTIKIEDVKNLPLSIFEECIEVDTPLSKYCLKLAVSYLKDINQEEWKTNLLSNGFSLKLLKIYHPEQLPFFIDAFKELLRDYATGDSSDKIPTATVDTIIEILNDQSYDLKTILGEIRDVFINVANINKEKLKYYGKWLFDYGRLQDKQDSLNKIFRSEYLDDNDIVQLVIEHQDISIAMVKKSKENTDFINKIEALSKSKYKDDEKFKEFFDSVKDKE